jgi:RNA polymerase sigma-70 factor (ECF subfamily)
LNERTDGELVQACLEGDRRAFTLLAERIAGPVFGLCLAMLGNADDAKDASQETLLRALEKMDKLREPERSRSWILSIARNLCIDRLERRKGEARPVREFEEEAHRIPNDHRDIHEALARLPEKYRLPLVLYYFDGRSTENIAEAFEMSRAGVLTRLSRGRRELRRLLSEKEHDHA